MTYICQRCKAAYEKPYDPGVHIELQEGRNRLAFTLWECPECTKQLVTVFLRLKKQGSTDTEESEKQEEVL